MSFWIAGNVLLGWPGISPASHVESKSQRTLPAYKIITPESSSVQHIAHGRRERIPARPKPPKEPPQNLVGRAKYGLPPLSEMPPKRPRQRAPRIIRPKLLTPQERYRAWIRDPPRVEPPRRLFSSPWPTTPGLERAVCPKLAAAKCWTPRLEHKVVPKYAMCFDGHLTCFFYITAARLAPPPNSTPEELAAFRTMVTAVGAVTAPRLSTFKPNHWSKIVYYLGAMQIHDTRHSAAWFDATQGHLHMFFPDQLAMALAGLGQLRAQAPEAWIAELWRVTLAQDPDNPGNVAGSGVKSNWAAETDDGDYNDDDNNEESLAAASGLGNDHAEFSVPPAAEEDSDDDEEEEEEDFTAADGSSSIHNKEKLLTETSKTQPSMRRGLFAAFQDAERGDGGSLEDLDQQTLDDIDQQSNTAGQTFSGRPYLTRMNPPQIAALLRGVADLDLQPPAEWLLKACQAFRKSSKHYKPQPHPSLPLTARVGSRPPLYGKTLANLALAIARLRVRVLMTEHSEESGTSANVNEQGSSQLSGELGSQLEQKQHNSTHDKHQGSRSGSINSGHSMNGIGSISNNTSTSELELKGSTSSDTRATFLPLPSSPTSLHLTPSSNTIDGRDNSRSTPKVGLKGTTTSDTQAAPLTLPPSSTPLPSPPSSSSKMGSGDSDSMSTRKVGLKSTATSTIPLLVSPPSSPLHLPSFWLTWLLAEISTSLQYPELWSPNELAEMVEGVVGLGPQPSQGWLDDLCEKLASRLHSYDPQPLVRTLRTLATALPHYTPPPAFISATAAAALERAPDLPPAAAASIAATLKIWGAPPTSEWVASFSLCSSRTLPSMSLRDMTDMVAALRNMDVTMPLSWCAQLLACAAVRCEAKAAAHNLHSKALSKSDGGNMLKAGGSSPVTGKLLAKDVSRWLFADLCNLLGHLCIVMQDAEQVGQLARASIDSLAQSITKTLPQPGCKLKPEQLLGTLKFLVLTRWCSSSQSVGNKRHEATPMLKESGTNVSVTDESQSSDLATTSGGKMIMTSSKGKRKGKATMRIGSETNVDVEIAFLTALRKSQQVNKWTTLEYTELQEMLKLAGWDDASLRPRN